MSVFLQRYKYLLIGGLILVIVLFFAFNHWSQSSSNIVSFESLETPEVEIVEETPKEEIVTLIVVEVKGAVQYPGVYELPVDARVKNVLDQAIVRSEGNLLHVNQSMKLKDEMVIYVPFEDEISEIPNSYMVESNVTENESSDYININTASKEQLMILNGIGDKTAQAIIDYREEHGLFMTKDALKEVNGIGDKKYLNIEQHIVIE